MKKLITVCLAIAMVACLSLSVFATTGGFTASPSGNPAPELVAGENESEDCVSQLIVTAYSDRDELSEEDRREIEGAYAEIMGTRDLATLTETVKTVAEAQGVATDDLAVSDLFDIDNTYCEGHEEHGAFHITLKAETLENFVCLLHLHDGVWHVVEGARVTEDGRHLTFDADKFSPFAIVVSIPEEVEEPNDNLRLVLITAIVSAVVVSAGFVTYWEVKRKEKAA